MHRLAPTASHDFVPCVLVLHCERASYTECRVEWATFTDTLRTQSLCRRCRCNHQWRPAQARRIHRSLGALLAAALVLFHEIWSWNNDVPTAPVAHKPEELHGADNVVGIDASGLADFCSRWTREWYWAKACSGKTHTLDGHGGAFVRQKVVENNAFPVAAVADEAQIGEGLLW